MEIINQVINIYEKQEAVTDNSWETDRWEMLLVVAPNRKAFGVAVKVMGGIASQRNRHDVELYEFDESQWPFNAKLVRTKSLYGVDAASLAREWLRGLWWDIVNQHPHVFEVNYRPPATIAKELGWTLVGD